MMKSAASIKLNEITETLGLDEIICDQEFFEVEKVLGCKMKQVKNVRSAGFYALGKAQGSNSRVGVVLQDEFLQLLSPVTEAFYQNVPLYIILFIADLNEANIVYNAFKTVAAQITFVETMEDICEKNGAGPIVYILAYNDKKIQDKRLIMALDNRRTIFYESVFCFDEDKTGIDIGKGYGVLSQYIGHIFARNEKSILYITCESFWKDMNALWIRGASDADGIIVVVGGAFEDIKAWGMTVHIPVFNMAQFKQRDSITEEDKLILLWTE